MGAVASKRLVFGNRGGEARLDSRADRPETHILSVLFPLPPLLRAPSFSSFHPFQSGSKSGNKRTVSGFVKLASIADAKDCLASYPKGRGRDAKTLFRGQHRLRVEEAISKGMSEKDRKEAVKGRKKRKRGDDGDDDGSSAGPGYSREKKKKRTREEILADAAAKSKALREQSMGLNQLWVL